MSTLLITHPAAQQGPPQILQFWDPPPHNSPEVQRAPNEVAVTVNSSSLARFPSASK